MPENEHEEEVQPTEEEHQEPTEEHQDDEQEQEGTELAKVRKEAAERRVALREAEAERDALREKYQALAVRHAAGGALADPSVLPWSDEFLTEEGEANFDAITEAAETYAEQVPHAAKVRGDVGQGFRDSASGSVDIAGMLKAGA